MEIYRDYIKKYLCTAPLFFIVTSLIDLYVQYINHLVHDFQEFHTMVSRLFKLKTYWELSNYDSHSFRSLNTCR